MAFFDNLFNTGGFLDRAGTFLGDTLEGLSTGADGGMITLADGQTKPSFGQRLGYGLAALDPMIQQNAIQSHANKIYAGGNKQAGDQYIQQATQAQALIDDRMERMRLRRKEDDEKAQLQKLATMFPANDPFTTALQKYAQVNPAQGLPALINYQAQVAEQNSPLNLMKIAQAKAEIEAARKKAALYSITPEDYNSQMQGGGGEIITPFVPGQDFGSNVPTMPIMGLNVPTLPVDELYGPTQPGRTQPPPAPSMGQYGPMQQNAPEVVVQAPVIQPAPIQQVQGPVAQPIQQSKAPSALRQMSSGDYPPGMDPNFLRWKAGIFMQAGEPEAAAAQIQMAESIEKQSQPTTELGKVQRDEQLGLVPPGTTEAEVKKQRAVADKAIREEADQVKAKENLEKTLARISSNLDELNKMNAIPSDDAQGGNELKQIGSNILNSAINTESSLFGFGPGGQSLARAVGTKAQTLRDKITADRQEIARLIKKATGMSSQEMNSNVELQNFLNSLGGGTYTYQTRKQIIRNISDAYGTGDVAKNIDGAVKENQSSTDGWSIRKK